MELLENWGAGCGFRKGGRVQEGGGGGIKSRRVLIWDIMGATSTLECNISTLSPPVTFVGYVCVRAWVPGVCVDVFCAWGLCGMGCGFVFMYWIITLFSQWVQALTFSMQRLQ